MGLHPEAGSRPPWRTARENCDLLIVSIHWGDEGSHTATSAQKRLGRAIVDAGARRWCRAPIPTSTAALEPYNGKYIVYSLGNFCFGGNRNPRDKDCMIFQQTFRVSADGAGGGRGHQPDPRPRVLRGQHQRLPAGQVSGAEAGQKPLSKIGKVSSGESGQRCCGCRTSDPTRGAVGGAGGMSESPGLLKEIGRFFTQSSELA